MTSINFILALFIALLAVPAFVIIIGIIGLIVVQDPVIKRWFYRACSWLAISLKLLKLVGLKRTGQRLADWADYRNPD